MIRLLAAVFFLAACSKKEEAVVPAAETPAPASTVTETPVPEHLKPSYLRIGDPKDSALLASGAHVSALRAHLGALGVPERRVVGAGLPEGGGRVIIYAKSADLKTLEAWKGIAGDKLVLLDETPQAVPDGLTVWAGDVAKFLEGLNGRADAGPEGFTVANVAKYAGGKLFGDGSLKLR